MPSREWDPDHPQPTGELDLMTVDTQTRQTVRAYHDARFLGDVPAAVAHLAEQFTLQSPLMSSDDATGHLAGLPGFLQVVTGVDMISELYRETEATLVYDVHTATPVGTQRTAEHFRLRNGRIASITLIFDATWWRPMMTTMGRAPSTGAATTQTT
jgi:ketosteroid isomerase-like protein